MATVKKIGRKFYGRYWAGGKQRFKRIYDVETLKEAEDKLRDMVAVDRGSATTEGMARSILSALKIECPADAEPLPMLTRCLVARSDLDTIGAAFVDRFKALEQDSKDKPQKLKTLAQSRHYWSRALSGAQSERVKIADAWEAWKSAPKKHKPSAETLDTAYLPLWTRFKKWADERGREYLHEITDADCLAYMTYLDKEGLSSKSRRHARTFLSGLWSALRIQAGLSDVWKAVPAPDKEQSVRKHLSTEEAKRLFAAALTPEDQTLLGLGLFCGLRLGDAACLKWSAVDLNRNFIELNPHKTASHGVAVRVPIHPALLKMLKALPEGKGEDYVLPTLANIYQADRANLSSRMRVIFERAKIATVTPDSTRIRGHSLGQFHRLRHSFITVLAQAGAPPATIRSLVGHTSAEIQKLYEHPGDADLKRAVAMLPDPRKRLQKKRD